MQQSDVVIQLIDPKCIDPESSINVRRSSSDNVAKLTEVMGKLGFLPEHPIMVRPHPRADSGFDYEVVAGQCRAAAARALEIEAIPAVVETLTDDAARLRSWHENEHRADLTPSDKAHWTKFFFDKYIAEGLPGQKALKAAAAELAIGVDTARIYWRLGGATEKVRSLIDSGDLKVGPANRIVEATLMGEGYADDAERLDARVDWYQGLAKDDRELGLRAMAVAPKAASVEVLAAGVETLRGGSLSSVSFEASREDCERLLDYGRARGITDIKQILSFIVSHALGPRQAA